MVIFKIMSKVYKFFVLQVTFISLKFAQTVFVSSIILSHVITELSIKLHTYLLFSQLHVSGFQI